MEGFCLILCFEDKVTTHNRRGRISYFVETDFQLRTFAFPSDFPLSLPLTRYGVFVCNK